MIWPAQCAHFAKMGFCEREQHLLRIEMSCVMGLDLMEGTRLFWGIPRAWHENLAPPPAVCPAERRAWDKCERPEAYTRQKYQPCCFVCVVLFYCLFCFSKPVGKGKTTSRYHSWDTATLGQSCLPISRGGTWGASPPSKLVWRQTITAEASGQWQVTATLGMILLDCLESNQMHERKAWVSSCFQGFTG